MFRLISASLAALIVGAGIFGCSSASDPQPTAAPYAGSKGLTAPPGATLPYPAGPYGVRKGDVVADMSFFGYASATDRKLKLISFHDYYDPDGKQGIKLLHFSAGAIWCQPCNLEAGVMQTTDATHTGTSVVADFEAQGVRFIQNLEAGAVYHSLLSATEQDLNDWLDSYNLQFPVFLDPARKLSIYFDEGSIPYTLFVDTQTMKILGSESGWGGEQALRDTITSYLSQ